MSKLSDASGFLSDLALAETSLSDPSAIRPQTAGLHHFFEQRCDVQPIAWAVICAGQQVTYSQLEARANQLAHLLADRGIGAGDKVGILLERSVETYISLLAVLKSGAAFVPLDSAFPPDHVAFIAKDAGLRLLLTHSSLAQSIGPVACPALALDGATAEISVQSTKRPHVPVAPDTLAYVIYTSGTTGRPKGVAVSHANICNFLSVVGPIYGYTRHDRVYQGMTIAFDFSIEEIWPSFMAGATLIAGPNDERRFGPGLGEFLVEQRVTVMCCVPTLLATLDGDLPALRLLLVGGEACPRDLVTRWARAGRRMLNTYGPTETTVTATWTELTPDKPVTIGQALPTYSVHLLNPDSAIPQPVPTGEIGEICIGGPSVARGYLNRLELTQTKFILDPFDSSRPGARLYRTGDLGRFTPDGEIEYLGRLDGQVKLHGYRIELSEIEAVLLECRELKNACVVKLAHEAGEDLAAYVTLRKAAADPQMLRSRLHELLLGRLPAYMIPAFIEFLDAIPTLPSGKADRVRLPVPASPRLAVRAGKYVPPATPLERELAAAWNTVFHQNELSVEADFFLDLGGHSLFAASVVSRLRKTSALRQLGVSDLYAHPTIRALARHIESNLAGIALPVERHRVRHGSLRVWCCGLGQIVMTYLLLIIPAALAAWSMERTYHPSVLRLLHDFLIYGPIALPLVILLLPILGKWVIIGRFRPGRYPLWGWYYCRWWVVRKLLSAAPLDLLAGSPLLGIYARLLGAKIGTGCHIATGQLELPDLIEIGDGAHIGYGVAVHPYIVEDGYLYLSPVRIGRNAFVGTNVVIMPGGNVGNSSRVTGQSLVARGQVIPDGQTWGGSPSKHLAEGAAVLDELHEQTARRSPPRKASSVLFTGYLLGFLLFELLPFLAALPALLAFAWICNRWGLMSGLLASPLVGTIFVLSVCAIVAVGKRIVMPRACAGIFEIHSAFGLRKWVADKLMEYSLAATNSLYATLYAVGWLRLLGAKVGPRSEVSTVSHIDPDLLQLGTESFLADIATVGAATYYDGLVCLRPAQLGSRCFVGNAALVPGNTRLGNNSLIGVLSVPPSDCVADGTVWLGSPAIFLPRREPSAVFDESVTFHPPPQLVVGRLAIEFLRVILPATLLFLMFLVDIAACVRLAGLLSGLWLIVILPAAFLAAGLGVFLAVVLLKWAIVGRYQPRVEPLWAGFVRRSELITGLYESAAVPALLGWFSGTPLLPLLLRLLGARMGRRIYLETTYLTEFDLVSVGNDSQIGLRTSLQTHLFEDRVMKMSNVIVGPGATLGPRSVVLYDSIIEAGARLDGLSLAMKGECLPADSFWRGIPARTADGQLKNCNARR